MHGQVEVQAYNLRGSGATARLLLLCDLVSPVALEAFGLHDLVSPVALDVEALYAIC